MDKSVPFLSIIIPVYNVELYIEDCLYSIINQNYTELEIILVDNNSSDNSYIICEKIARQYSFIKLFSEKVQGTASTRNLGLKNAAGKYIWFVDGDDLIHPFSIKIINDLLVNMDYDILKFNYISFENEINEIDNSKINFNNNHSLESIFQSSVCVFVYKRAFIIGHNLYFKSDNYFEDTLFNIQLFSNNFKILAIENILYYYRKTPYSKTQKVSNELIKKRVESINEIVQLCSKSKDIYFINKVVGYHLIIIEYILVFYKSSKDNFSKETIKFLKTHFPKLSYHPLNRKKNAAIWLYNFNANLFFYLLNCNRFFNKSDN